LLLAGGDAGNSGGSILFDVTYSEFGVLEERFGSLYFESLSSLFRVSPTTGQTIWKRTGVGGAGPDRVDYADAKGLYVSGSTDAQNPYCADTNVSSLDSAGRTLWTTRVTEELDFVSADPQRLIYSTGCDQVSGTVAIAR
jgi:hypothetical protein